MQCVQLVNSIISGIMSYKRTYKSIKRG